MPILSFEVCHWSPTLVYSDWSHGQKKATLRWRREMWTRRKRECVNGVITCPEIPELPRPTILTYSNKRSKRWSSGTDGVSIHRPQVCLVTCHFTANYLKTVKNASAHRRASGCAPKQSLQSQILWREIFGPQRGHGTGHECVSLAKDNYWAMSSQKKNLPLNRFRIWV